jgi:hypothetical protein
VALDRVSSDREIVTFRDVDEDNGMWRRIPFKGGRGIVVVENSERVVVTDHCMAVCCRVLTTWLMDIRWCMTDLGTVDQVGTEWVGVAGSIAKHIGGAHRRDKDVAEVKVVMKALDSWRRKNMARTSNIIALPPFDSQMTVTDSKWRSPPYTVWR